VRHKTSDYASELEQSQFDPRPSAETQHDVVLQAQLCLSKYCPHLLTALVTFPSLHRISFHLSFPFFAIILF
jgi:hypothetical protein